MTLDADTIPFCVPPDWARSVYIPGVGAPTYRVLFYDNGEARFEHECDRGERGVIICAPLLGDGHVIEHMDELRDRLVFGASLTISPSILCPDCGTHGFIQEGRWVAA